MERKKILFVDKTKDDSYFLLIITDATKDDIESYCRWHTRMIEKGMRFELFAPLKARHYVKELLDSDVDDLEDVDIIGFDACYDFGRYTKLIKRVEGFRTIKFTAGMMSDFEIITTNAPNSVIKANMQYINSCEEDGEKIINPYRVIESMGYVVNLIGNQDDLSSEDLEDAIIDEEFDYYNI